MRSQSQRQRRRGGAPELLDSEEEPEGDVSESSSSSESSESEPEEDRTAQGEELELIAAARAGDLLRVKSAIRAGARLRAVLSNGTSALHAACSGLNDTEINRTAVVKHLVLMGADASVQDQQGETPLQMAMDHMELPIMHLLLSADSELSESMSRKAEQVCDFFELEATENEDQDLMACVNKVRRQCGLTIGTNHVQQEVARRGCEALLLQATSESDLCKLETAMKQAKCCGLQVSQEHKQLLLQLRKQQCELSELCVVCRGSTVEVGLLHGDTVHVCCCVPCSQALLNRASGCPLCHEQVTSCVRVQPSARESLCTACGTAEANAICCVGAAEDEAQSYDWGANVTVTRRDTPLVVGQSGFCLSCANLRKNRDDTLKTQVFRMFN
eukprot:TRINITY_DN33805_c0_g1_i1.p1 TRINITY_DN33805_c0_g1~~TRINITY_DN33805_c0_g1_i1.p1  ORF type:complete len:387 (+),score=102.39 TRINITY_DN33805_c0_g1_i1:342-1502(+)